LLRGERVGVGGNSIQSIFRIVPENLLRGERVGVGGNINRGISKLSFIALAKGRKSWGGRKLAGLAVAVAVDVAC